MSVCPMSSAGRTAIGRFPSDGYRRAFDVLEHCADAVTVESFAERLLESMSSTFNIRYVTFFVGDSLDAAHLDPSAQSTGGSTGRRMMVEYADNWVASDPFVTAGPQQQLKSTGVASLCENYSLPPASRNYVTSFLYKRSLASGTAMWIPLAGRTSALVGLFDPSPDAVTVADLPLLRKLRGQLSVLGRSLTVVRESALSVQLAQVTPRQRDVATLIAGGLTNAAIADRLNLTEDTVKKYVSRLLAATGCSSRTELALAVQQQAMK